MPRNFAIVPLFFASSLGAQIIDGTAVDSVSRQPVAGATVDVEPWKSGKAVYHATTDAAGHFRIENAAPGAYGFECSAAGYLRASRGPVQVVAGGTGEPLELLMIRAATVSVRVVDDQGKLVPRAILRIGMSGSILLKSPAWWTDNGASPLKRSAATWRCVPGNGSNCWGTMWRASSCT